MKTTRLFDKKWSNFAKSSDKNQIERYVFNEILKPGFQSSLPGAFTLFTKDLPEFVKRCDKCFMQIIGIETHLDGKYPLHIWCVEEYGEDLKDNLWIDECMGDIMLAGIEKDLVVYIDIPENKISILRNIYNT